MTKKYDIQDKLYADHKKKKILGYYKTKRQALKENNLSERYGLYYVAQVYKPETVINYEI